MPRPAPYAKVVDVHKCCASPGRRRRIPKSCCRGTSCRWRGPDEQDDRKARGVFCPSFSLTIFVKLGRSGKSVARSYAAALDLLVPVETSISGAIAGADITQDPSKQLIKNQYDKAMHQLAEKPDKNGKSKLENYIIKQTAWAEAEAKFAKVQKEQRAFLKELFPDNIEKQRNEFSQ
jgi:hypothetical protein